MTKTVLITGASGKIGRHAARAFEAAGWTVRKFKRGTDMIAAAQGADVIVNGMNPPAYHNWAEIIPQITEQHIAAAQVSGATVIIPGNVYNFGNQIGAAWDENTPHAPTSRKGQIRKEMEQRYAQSGVQTIILRAGNFIDPDGHDDVMDIMVLRGMQRGRIGRAGPAHTTQEWCYLPDWARAAVALADKRDQLAAFEDVPFGNHALNAEELRQTMTRLTGRSYRFSTFPWWAMRLLSPFWELARELSEMRYLSETDHRLSDDKLMRLLPGFKKTPLSKVLASKLPDAEGITADAPITAA